MLFSNASLVAQGQVNLVVDSTHFLIGDPLEIQVVVNVDQGTHINFPAIAEILEKEGLEVLELSEKETLLGKNATTFKQKIQITAWEPKEYTIPSLVFTYVLQTDSIRLKSMPLILQATVPRVTGDSTYIADIETIIAEQPTWLDQLLSFLLQPVFIALLLLVFFALAIRWILQFKKRRAEKVVLLSPEEQALLELDKLKENNPLATNDFKAFHTQISFILRAYIGRRFEVKALESPLNDFLPLLQKHHFLTDNSLFEELETVLQHADLIKFAKASPLDIANTRALELSYKLVQSIQSKLKEEALAEAAQK